jgi:two-component system sensor histidine kinase KdpD
VQRLTRLIENVIDVGRLEIGDVTPVLSETTVDIVLDDALAQVRTGGRRLDLDVAADLPAFSTDRVMAARAIAIVVGNAIQFGPSHEPVRITAGVTEQSVEFLVIDRGPGMSVARRDEILDPDSRLSRTREGMDLGLTVATNFVRLLGGAFRFEDTPGGGLTVVMEFPLHPPNTDGAAV